VEVIFLNYRDTLGIEIYTNFYIHKIKQGIFIPTPIFNNQTMFCEFERGSKWERERICQRHERGRGEGDDANKRGRGEGDNMNEREKHLTTRVREG